MSKKGENIYKRKDGRWEARYIKAYKVDGKAKYGYCYGKTYREAKSKVSIAKANCPEQTFSNTKEQQKNIEHICDEWLQLKRCNVKTSTYVKYASMIKKHIKPTLGKYMTGAMTSLHVEQFAYDLMHRDMLAAKTVKDILTVLHSVLSYGEKHYHFPNHVEIIYPKIEKKEMRVLTRSEQKQFMQYLLQDMDLCKFGTLFALLTGLRLGEICALRWQDISLEEQVVSVRSTMQRIKNPDIGQGKKTQIIISAPKSSTSARMIPLSPLAQELCTRFSEEQEAYVLTGKTDRYIEPRILQYRMKCYATECDLQGVHFHTLRHSFATRCVEVGFEIKSLSEILGHASPKITLERYVHSSLELKRENMKKLSVLGY